jgi:integrase
MLRNVLKEVYPWRRSQYVLPNLAEQCQILDKNGKNLGANMLNTDIMRVIRWIGLEPTAEVPGHKKKVTVYGFHSLRHSFASHCVESGVPQSTAQSILKDSGQLLDRYYNQSRNASQKKKMKSSFGNNGTVSTQERIDNALAYIANIEDQTPEIKEIAKHLKGH